MSSSHRIRMRHLRCFLAIARSGSVTRASEELGVVQPSVSRSIKELEEDLGKVLFERTPKGMILTDDGQVFFSHVAGGLEQIDTGLEAMRGLEKEQQIIAYVLPNVVRTIMPEAIKRFKQLFPGVDVLMPATAGGGWQSLLESGGADFAFGRLLAAEQMKAMSFEHLFDEPLTFFVRSGHPLTRVTDVSLDDIDRFPVVLPLPKTIIRNEIDRFLIASGKRRFSNVIETLSFEFARNLLAISDGVICQPLGAMDREMAEGRVCRLEFADGELTSAVGLSVPTGRRVSDSAKILMQIIREVVRDRENAKGIS